MQVLIGVNRQHGQDKKSKKLGLIGFELALFCGTEKMSFLS